MPTVIATKTLVFTDHKQVSGAEAHIKLEPAQGAQEIPEWAVDTLTYEMAKKSGAIVILGAINPGGAPKTIAPPTIEELTAIGWNSTEAEKIATEENRKFEAGEPPYPPRRAAPPAVATVDTLMAAGLDRATAERVIAERDNPPTADDPQHENTPDIRQHDVHGGGKKRR